MKIENKKEIGLIEELLKSRNVRSQEEGRVSGRRQAEVADKIEITNKAEVKRLRQLMESIPAVRQEKVDRIREAIESKTYNVRGELVAKSLLKSHIFETVL
jgi:flagellar biosynthesis anti-sigma factor FlgM